MCSWGTCLKVRGSVADHDYVDVGVVVSGFDVVYCLCLPT